MYTTGIFFHYQDGKRLQDFPQALQGILTKDNVFFYDAFYPLKTPSSFDLDSIPIEIVEQVHSPDMIQRVGRSPAFEGVLLSVSSTVAAAIRICNGEIDNAFVFTGYGDHHAGSNFFGGGCYFNGAAIAISELRKHFKVRKFAIIDTDAHHGDGTWELFRDDPDVLYICFCTANYQEVNSNVNVQVPWIISDADYIQMISAQLAQRMETFQPEIIFWNWGYDGTQGDYGDIGLTPDSHIRLASDIKQAADKICHGRLIVVLCGGSRRDLAHHIIPRIIHVLAE